MEQSKLQGKGLATLQAWGSEPHGESQLPVFADPTNVLTISHQAGAMEDRDVVGGAQTMNFSDASIDKTKIAQAALGYRPKNHQVSDMESIKALLRNFLDGIQEPQPEHSSYLDGLLTQWLDIWRRDRTDSLLIYILGDRSGQYGNRMFDVNELETIDETKTRVLEHQCLRRDVCVYLAKMTSAVNTDPDDTHELEMAISLHEICDLSGELLATKPVAVGRKNVLQKSVLEERYYQQTAKENPYPKPTEGKPSVHIDTAKSFQDWVLLIMPETCRFEFLTVNANPQALHDWIKTQSADLQASEIAMAAADPNVRWGLKLACNTQLSNVDQWLASNLSLGNLQEFSTRSDKMEAVVCASSRLRSPELFHKAVILNPRMLSLTTWEEVGSTMDLAHFLSYRNSLNQALCKIDSFQDRYVTLQSIQVGCETQNEPQDSMEMVHSWIQDCVGQALNEIKLVEENDGAMLVLVAKKFAPAITMNRIVSFARKHSSNHAFALEFAFSLYDELVANTMDAGFVRYALAEILSSAVPALCVRGAHNWFSHQGFPSSASFDVPTQDQPTLQADSMARLVRCCLTVGLRSEEHSLLREFWLGASIADPPTLQHVFLPYLKNLLKVMHDHRIPLTTQSYQWQFQHVITLFIIRYIGKEPTPLFVDLTCPPLGCASPTNPYGCPTCLELDAFLVDPHRKTADVTGGIDAPEHVAAQVQGTDYLQMTVTSRSAEHMTCTIRMTKPEKLDARHDLWKVRVVKANDLIQDICGDDEWKILLGDKYDECMGLKGVRAG